MSLGLLLALALQAHPINLDYSLDIEGPLELSARIQMNPADRDLPSIYLVKVVFTAKRGQKVVARIRRDLGQTFALNVVECGWFLGNKHEQLFVTTEMGAVESWMFDFDGKTVRTPYHMAGGRVLPYPSFDETGRCQIAEVWPARQYEDEFGKYRGPRRMGTR